MRQLTIRGFDLELEQRIRSLAQREGISINKAALRLLRKGAEAMEGGQYGRIGSRLEKYAGTMPDSEARELLESLSDSRRIDPEMWQ